MKRKQTLCASKDLRMGQQHTVTGICGATSSRYGKAELSKSRKTIRCVRSHSAEFPYVPENMCSPLERQHVTSIAVLCLWTPRQFTTVHVAKQMMQMQFTAGCMSLHSCMPLHSCTVSEHCCQHAGTNGKTQDRGESES